MRSRNMPYASKFFTKGDFISEGILTLVPLPIKGAKLLPWTELFKKLFTVMDGNFKCSTHTLAKTEIIYPKNVGAQVAMDFT